MPDQYEPFTPQSVDEQIEQLLSHPQRQHQASTPEAELVMDMHNLYHEYAGTRDRVRRRLQEQMASRSKTAQVEMGTVRSLPPERQRLQRGKNMYPLTTSSVKTRSFKPRLALMAATLFAALLIVSLVVIVPFVRSYSTQPNTPTGVHKSTPRPTASQTVTGTQTPPATHQSGFIYITNGSGILKLDSNTGTTLQTYPWPNKGIYHTGGTIEPYTLQISGKLLFMGFQLINSQRQVIYGGVQAFDTSKDQMLWEFDGTTNNDTTLTIANGTVYLSVDHPDIVGRSLVFALRATDGKQLASYDLPLAIQKLTVAGNFLYPIGYESFYGVNLTTKATWHIPGPQGAGVGFSDLHVVNGVLYVALFQSFTTGSFILALNPATGQELWRTQAFQGQIYNFIIAQNVAYFGMAPIPNGNTGRFDAYNLSQRKLLWEVHAGIVARTYAVANNTIYAVIQSPYAGGFVAPELIALSTRNGHQLWKITAGSAYYKYTPVVATNGSLYIVADTKDVPVDNIDQYFARQMEMINQANGNVIWKKTFTSQIGGYVLIA